jgi:glycosyltransferase involved in cell wall biosynthesis
MIRKNLLSRIIRLAERYVYKNATMVSANNPAMAEYCIEESGRTGPTVVNLPPIDLGHFAASDHTSRRADLGLDATAKVVLYMGTFFPFSGLDTVIRNMAPHFVAHTELRLVLVGGGELDEVLRASVRELGLTDRVIFTGVVPYAELPGYLRAADVAINPFVPELLTNVAFPHKVLQYMAAGVPAVSTLLRGLRGVLGDDAGVTWVDEPAGMAEAAVRLAYADPAGLARIGAVERAFITANFSKEIAADSLESLLISLR